MTETIVILDFGSPYSPLIARRVRESQVYAELLPWDTPESAVMAHNPEGFILSGCLRSALEPGAPVLPGYVIQSRRPILGIGSGMSALVLALGGRMTSTAAQKYDLHRVNIPCSSRILQVGDDPRVWMSCADRVDAVPEGFQILASAADCPIAALGDGNRDYYGLQFHPGLEFTPAGRQIIARFVRGVCQCSGDWTAQAIIDHAVRQVRTQVGDARVLSTVSGGVDSSVATALVSRAVGDQLSAVYVDTGLMRKDETQWVRKAFQDKLGANLHCVDAAETFFFNLQGITDPEAKRRVIGETFIRVFEATTHNLGDPPFLVQGTIYPDVIESRNLQQGDARPIKTHHNVGGLPEAMDFELVEPLQNLFKDEVRVVGEALGLPSELVWRQPFPGPGLAVRCLGEVTPGRVEKLRQADAIFTEELAHAGLLVYRQGEEKQGTAQAFAVLLPVKTVGMANNQRTYEEVIALRAVTTTDFMTADWARLPDELLARVAYRIVDEVQGVNRVVYDITSKPPGTIEWE
ncbi:MAG TPA: glutamine-hydrolyzing GMP synthase [Brevefilum sp.]|nr:glutamine-hydrolyzing GMP synthase [Brevefilum sp.]HOR18794.1 glutamine-hydrolyzing GMP synthase [Brevefilum sp.]HPL68695.1 glutamine-hydrolyzing GMP synthase [Brevefilum sp.]